MKYRLYYNNKIKELDITSKDMKKIFIDLKRKYKGTGTLIQVLQFKNDKWVGYLRN